MEEIIVDAVTPLQCFIVGIASSLLVCSALWFLGWRYLDGLRKRNPDYFANLAKEGELKRERRASLEEEVLHLRRREVELMERIVENQEVMIGLLRQSLSEKSVL
jgi:hypothetical protein